MNSRENAHVHLFFCVFFLFLSLPPLTAWCSSFAAPRNRTHSAVSLDQLFCWGVVFRPHSRLHKAHVAGSKKNERRILRAHPSTPTSYLKYPAALISVTHVCSWADIDKRSYGGIDKRPAWLCGLRQQRRLRGRRCNVRYTRHSESA